MVIYYWKLQPPDKLIFNMIEGGAGVGGMNDLIHWSERRPFYVLFAFHV